ncbi:MAG: S46 family peptidase, partial [Bacteroidetes bacterium]|nr:S46 family peptidase [Bacteroidota bacterium]
MNKLKLWMTTIAVSVSMIASATEGMWVVALLNRIQHAEMNNMGLKLTQEEIYSINQACLKDAIVRLNYGGCTGEVVSDKGLVFTNHHCAYDGIQTLSTVDKNYLQDGFCAKSFAEELPIPNFAISFLIRVEDVTAEVLGVVTDGMTESERDKAIGAKMREISGRNKENGKYEPEVKSFFYGNEFYLFVYQTFNDIRLVGNPPESVGKFGGDTDNWMWPRHTGDFSMIRIYANDKNEPAPYSVDNKPYSPKYHLKTNIEGVKEGDYAMIMGYPGRTSRYLTSYGINQAISGRNPALIESFGTKLETWKMFMDEDPAIRLMYAAKYASTANTWKYYIGQTQGLKKLDVKSKKANIETNFTQWIIEGEEMGDPSRKAKYGNALNTIQEYHNEWDSQVVKATYAGLCLSGGAEFMGHAVGLKTQLTAYLAETDAAKKDELKRQILADDIAFHAEYNADVDQAVFVALIQLFMKNVDVAQHPAWTKDILGKKFKGDINKMAAQIFGSSMAMNTVALEKFFAKPSQKVLDKDLGLTIAALSAEYVDGIRALNPIGKFNKGYREFVAGYRKMESRQLAPDANSTMRVTYGQIKNYKAADALIYDYYTTTNGILEKWDNSNPEFVVPDKLVELIKTKDFGRYANEKGELVTCFIGDLDITGGNSGSPVMDANGNWIGLAFDGNWEAMSGDIAYEKDLQRTICVDIRYVL